MKRQTKIFQTTETIYLILVLFTCKYHQSPSLNILLFATRKTLLARAAARCFHEGGKRGFPFSGTSRESFQATHLRASSNRKRSMRPIREEILRPRVNKYFSNKSIRYGEVCWILFLLSLSLSLFVLSSFYFFFFFFVFCPEQT